jgi:predicted  nucleic acid-binding Zn-ribbon protein
MSITPTQPNMPNMNPKTFWQRPEGVTGALFMAAIIGGGGYMLYKILPVLQVMVFSTLQILLGLIGIAVLLYVILDPKMRNLIWYMYKSVMRWITGVFVNIDPIGILKSYVEKLEGNLGKMSKQIGNLQGQMTQLKGVMDGNNKEVENAMKRAEQAKKQGLEQQITLETRKAARLQDSNEKYRILYGRMDLLKKVLTKMYDNSEILMEDTKDQVRVKEQERKAIRTSHSAMQSAMSVLSGDPDQRAMFEMAMENINNDVAGKVGEMERFMEASSKVMSSIDLQNGIFEDEGAKMLEQWEKGNILSDEKFDLKPLPKGDQANSPDNSGYDSLFR